MKKQSTIVSFVIMLACLMLLSQVQSAFADSTPPPTPTPLSPLEEQIRNAIFNAITTAKAINPIYEMFPTQVEQIRIASTQDKAVAWLILLDPDTKQPIPSEPGLTVVQMIDNQWTAVLPGDSDWFSNLQQIPGDLLTEDEKIISLNQYAEIKALTALGTFSGYRLPWAPGQVMVLTQSVQHDKYTPSLTAHYSFDFATQGAAQMWNIYASKSGTVWMAKDSCDNGSTTCSNWLVLQDLSTNPTTYQLYMHLAKGSIPAELHTGGAKVKRGQFIAIADDTGVSTANHLHFMVHTNPASYWGTSVDITFEEVGINGGRPRILADKPYCRNDATYHDVCEQFSSTYTSANYYLNDQVPPTGDITSLKQGDSISSSILHLTGWVNDNKTGIASATLLFNSNGSWQQIGNPFSSKNFSLDYDLCAANLPDGPYSVALQIFDKAGNQSAPLTGLKQFFKNYTCPSAPPACVPADNQIAIFSEPDYQGSCSVLSTGSYTSSSFGNVKDNDISSLLVGSSVSVSAYLNSNYRGRGETFFNSDANLSDNGIDADTISSIIISSRSNKPSAPLPISPGNTASFVPNSSITFYWDNLGNALEYQVKLVKSGGTTTTSDWLSIPYWLYGSISTGTYTWQVKARNPAGESLWSSTFSFTVSGTAGTPSTVTVPFNDNFETAQGWSPSNYFDQTTELNHTSNGSLSWKYDANVKPEDGYDTTTPNSGFLTSPQIVIPASSDYSLHFWYRYQTESPNLHWDQRWVQVAVNGGNFENIYQFHDDPMNAWLQSPPISLRNYAGKTIQIRFYFNTLDKHNNKFKGWYLDDVSISATEIVGCNDPLEPNDAVNLADPINLNTTIQSKICPAGDMDFYKFNANAGDHIGVYVKADRTNPNAILDPYVYLLDSDGTSVLAEDDDRVLAQLTDSEISYWVKRTGTYYLKIKAFDYPESGNPPLPYTLYLFNDPSDPIAEFVQPRSRTILTDRIYALSIAGLDNSGIISHIQYYWHSSNWSNDTWRYLGEDWDSSDGWNFLIDLNQFPDQIGMAFYAKVFDIAGNSVSVGVFNLNKPHTVMFLPIISK